MERFIEYINASLPDNDSDNILFRFKRKTLDEMNQRFLDVQKTGGIYDFKVIEDLIKSEHSDLKSEYERFYKRETAKMKARRNAVLNVVGSLIYIIALVTAFLGISFMTKKWSMTWAIIVDGILIWVVYLLGLLVKKFTSMKRIFHIIARVALFGAVVCFTVAVYLFLVAITDLPHGWVIVIFGLILAFITDGLFVTVTKSKLAILHWLLYIPVISVFAFIIIGALNILAWKVAWMVIPLSLIIDLLLIVSAIAKNKADKMEVADIWQEG